MLWKNSCARIPGNINLSLLSYYIYLHWRSSPGHSRGRDCSWGAVLQCNWWWQPHTWQQRFIHAFLCCPAGGRERGDWVTHPSAHWLVLWKCVWNDLSHLALSLSITYTQTNASEECREKACSFKATAWEERGPGDTCITHVQHSHVPTERNVWQPHTSIYNAWGRFVRTFQHAQTFYLKLHQMERGFSSPSYVQAKQNTESVFWVVIHHSIHTLCKL